MLPPQKTSDFVFREIATGVLTADSWNGITDTLGGARSDALNVPVPAGLRYRNVYLGWIFTASPATTQAELRVQFCHAGREVAVWTIGQANGVAQARDGFAPPFSVQEIALGSLSSNQPALVGGDVPGSILVSDYNLLDGVQRYVRLTALPTYQECDEIRISGRVYVGSTTGAPVFKLFAAVNSSIVKL